MAPSWTPVARAAALLVVAAAVLGGSVAGAPTVVTITETASDISISNGFVLATFSKTAPALTELRGDFNGTGAYGPNTLAGSTGVVLEVETHDGGSGTRTSAANAARTVPLVVATAGNGTAQASISLANITVSLDSTSQTAAVAETWVISLIAGARTLAFHASGSTLTSFQAKAVRRSWFWQPTSVYGFFDEGVVQMRGAGAAGDFFATCAPAVVQRVYAVGTPSNTDPALSIDVLFNSAGALPSTVSQSVLLSSTKSPPYWSGFQQVVAGSFDQKHCDKWSLGWLGSPVQSISSGQTWTHSLLVAPSNVNAPVGTLPAAASPNLPPYDLLTLLLGIYPSIVGNLNTYPNEVQDGAHVYQLATTIHKPVPSYTGLYSFWDPDNFLGVSAMLYSGDAYLQEQARLCIERSGAFLLPTGQLPHHFEGTKPLYNAISGAEQTGPNIFWTLTALRYAGTSGNRTWLEGYMPKLRQSAAFLLHFMDAEHGLLSVPGSLMIDVFIRNNLTADSNAMMVGFLREFAEAEASLGNSTGASQLQAVADRMAAAMNALLWDTSSQDHYLTQLDPATNATRDFVDYDANFIALAHGVANATRAAAFFQRFARGACAKAITFVSEIWYGPHDCFNGNVGDSWTAMGRIGYFNALARKRFADRAYFDHSLVEPLQHDLVRDTWMSERYGCDAVQQANRSSAYFEYPALVTMLLREIRYGIVLKPGSVEVEPFGPSSFAYHVGNVNVDYSSEAVVVAVPGQGQTRNYVFSGLKAGATYQLASTASPDSEATCSVSPPQATADSSGTLRFSATTGGCTVTAKM